jgi:hypothetical protein
LSNVQVGNGSKGVGHHAIGIGKYHNIDGTGGLTIVEMRGLQHYSFQFSVISVEALSASYE